MLQMATVSKSDTLTHIDMRISVDEANCLLNMGLAKEVESINKADFVITNISKAFLLMNKKISELESKIANLSGELQ